ncbi:hypothetical protein AB6A68_02425 [Ferrimicrobium acidiphilum]|uniref:Uncharacterized protein n=1 Tax=Ferrimicrobium acidiphilum TaxID=121039 RepID=A0ABV3XZG0_9ACTN
MRCLGGRAQIAMVVVRALGSRWADLALIGCLGDLFVQGRGVVQETGVVQEIGVVGR